MSDEEKQKLNDDASEKLPRNSAAQQKNSQRILENETLSLGSDKMAANQSVENAVSENFENQEDKFVAGKCFGHYEILEKLGVGGMGEVYLAEDKKLERRVAVKVLGKKFAEHGSNLRRFEREAKAASALNHPNILVIHEIGESEGTSYIVSEFIEGKTLRELIALSLLKTPETLDISIQIANALCVAHAAKIVHRDIKPENIIVRPDGYVKILDFGLAKLIERQQSSINLEVATAKQNETAQGIIMGTVNYMSPEQAKGEKIDERTDVFSFGAVIYEMIAGKTPFAGDSMSETFANLIKSEPLPLSQIVAAVPKELERIVLKTLRKNKGERYQSMMDLLTDLREFKESLRFSGKPERSGETGEPEGATVILPPPMTDDINRQTGEVRRGFIGSIKQYKSSAIAGLVFFLIALAVGGYFAFFNRSVALTSASQIKSVMVLPLKNIGGDAQDEYLSDGITDELITKLTKLKTVRVVSPSAAMRYKNSPKDAAEIGREMNVEAVIEGTIRKQANKFRVSLHLVNAQDGFELWSDDDFESELNNLLDAEGQIAEKVASRLKGQLTAQERSIVAGNSTTNADAYEFFLRGKQQIRKGDSQMARNFFDRAIQLDPNFTDAYAWRGLVIYRQFKAGRGDRAILDAALSDANRALQTNPTIISARVTLINIYHSTGQYEEGLKQGKQLLEINPDDLDSIEGAALAYFRAGMVNKAVPLYQKAVAADPTDTGIRQDLARCYAHAGEYQKGIDVLSPVLAQDKGEWMAMGNYSGLRQFDKAIKMGKMGISKDPDNANGWIDYGEVLAAAGKPEQAHAVWAEGASREEAKLANFENVRTRIWLGILYAHLGEHEKALTQINRALALEPDDAWTLFQVGAIYALLNNRFEAVSYLKKSIAHGWLGIHYINQPDKNRRGDFANLRGDSEFEAVRSDLQKKVDELAKQY